MAKVEEKENSFLKKLTTPLGIGTALVVSAGIGLGLLFLKNKLQKSESEYDKILQKIKAKIEEEKDLNTYSDDLISLVYETVPLITQEEFNKFATTLEEEKIQVVDDIPKYCASVQKFGIGVGKVLDAAFAKIIQDAGGVPDLFLKAEGSRKNNSQKIFMKFQKLIGAMKSKTPKPPNKHKITEELVKKVCAYESELFEELKGKDIKTVFPIPPIIMVWVPNKVYAKFGIDINSEEVAAVVQELMKKDPEFKKKAIERNTLIGEVLRSVRP